MSPDPDDSFFTRIHTGSRANRSASPRPQPAPAALPQPESGAAAAIRRAIDEQIDTARSGMFLDSNFAAAVNTLAQGASDPSMHYEVFRPRAAALAAAVCRHGNNKVPATLIKALFDSRRQGHISAQQLQITLHELTKVRFAQGMDATDVMHYLNIVGKAANHPDERLFVLRPLAAVVQDLAAQRKPAPGTVQLQVSLDAASEYFPSWRREDTNELLRQGSALPFAPLPLERPDVNQRKALYVEAVKGIDTAIHKTSSHDQVKRTLKTLAGKCGDLHLSEFAKYLRDNVNSDDESIERYRVVMDHIAQLLRDERSSFELSIRPFTKHMTDQSMFRDKPLHKAAMTSLCVVAGLEDGREGNLICLNSLTAVHKRDLNRDEQAAYDTAVANAKKRIDPTTARANAAARSAARAGMEAEDVPYL